MNHLVHSFLLPYSLISKLQYTYPIIMTLFKNQFYIPMIVLNELSLLFLQCCFVVSTSVSYFTHISILISNSNHEIAVVVNQSYSSDTYKTSIHFSTIIIYTSQTKRFYNRQSSEPLSQRFIHLN